MAAFRNPPPEQPIRTYPSPDITDQVVLEWVTTELASSAPVTPGTAHPNTRDFSGFTLGKQVVNPSDHNFFIRYYVKDQPSPDAFSPAWNYALKYSGQSNSHPIVIRAYRLLKDGYSPLTKGTALADFPSAILVEEEAQQFPADSEFYAQYFAVVRVYETLPGPYIPFTRYDDNLGPIQGKRRAVLNTGQAASLTATTKTTYEGRDGSSIVSWEITETWSDGTGGGGNPAYPLIGPTYIYDNERGNVKTTTQVVVATGSETATLTVSGGIATKIEYFPLEGYSPFLLKKVIETWALPGPLATSTEFDRDGIKKVVTRQMMDTDNVVTSEDLTAGVLTHKFKERLNKEIAFQVIETITVDDAGLLDDPEFTVSIPNVIPEIFRALIPTRTEGHIVAGEATEPTLGLGEFERSEKALTPLYKEVRFTVLDDIGALPISITGLKETNEDKQVVTVSLTLELDSATPTVPDEVTDVEFRKLGNGLAVETLRVIPEVFPNDSYTKTVLNLIPEKLRAAIPIVETTIDSPGSPDTDPTLLTGELSRTESRLTTVTKRVRITSLGEISVPVSISETRTRADKQVETVTYTLELQGTSVATPDAVTDVAVEDLGNGYEVQTVATVPEVFKAGSYTKSVRNLIPPELTAAIPTVQTEETSAGTASTNPTLLTGELSRNEEQVNEDTKRIRITSFGAISVPISITALETNADKQIVSIVYTLETAGTNAVVPTALIDVTVQNLGNGYEVVTKRTIPSVFPANTYSISVLNLIPETLRATIPITESDVTSAGTASTNPSLLTGELSRSETQVANFVKRIRTTSLGAVSVPVSVTRTETSRDKQLVTIVDKLELTGTSTATITSTRDVAVRDLGNGYEVETVTMVDDVFPAGSYTKTILNLIPPELRATIPITETEETSAGTASTDPTLLTGELSRNEQQIDETRKRVRITSLGSVSVPVTITALETNRDKQVVTITYSLVLDSATPAVPTALRDVEFRDLGNGYAIQTTKDIAAVFPANTYSKSIIDLIPAKLRAAVPMYESDVTSAGTAATTIVLLTGELSRAETQVANFVKRVRVTSLGSISVPVILVNEELTDKFGGGVVEETITLNSSAGTIDEGLTVLESSVVNLGNGYYIKVTKELVDAAWPTLTSYPFDEEMQVITPVEQQIVAPSYTITTGSNFVETLKAVDKWRSQRIKITKDPDAVDESTAIVSEVWHPYEFPALVNLQMAYQTGGEAGFRKAVAQSVKHTIKTWWESSPTPPVIAVDEIITNTLYIGLATPHYATFHNVLHDLYAGAVYIGPQPATTPSYSEYVGIVPIAGTDVTFTNADATVTVTGGNLTADFVAGDLFMGIPVDSITNNTTLELVDPWPGPTITLTLQPFVIRASVAWIGNPKIVAATVKLTDVPELWQIQTTEIVMR
jgi:hypothetical protein